MTEAAARYALLKCTGELEELEKTGDTKRDLYRVNGRAGSLSRVCTAVQGSVRSNKCEGNKERKKSG